MLLNCPPNSSLWDWDVSWNTSWPDLTECCHHRLLVLVPLITALLAWPLASCDTKRRGEGSWRKTLRRHVFIVILVIVQLADVLLLWQNSNICTSAIFRLCSTLLASTALRNDQGGSAAHFIHWFTTSICLLLNAHSAYMFGSIRGWTEHHESLVPLQFALSATIWILGMPKRRRKYARVGERQFVKDRTSFASHLFLCWVTPTLVTSWRRPLEFSDLMDFDIEDTAEIVRKKWKKSWEYIYPKGTSGKEVNMVWILCNNFGFTYFITVILDTLSNLLYLSTPRLQGYLIGFAGKSSNDEENWKGYFYALTLFSVLIIDVIIRAQSTYMLMTMATKIRSGLMTHIYKKILRLGPSARHAFTDGEIFNFMTVDNAQFNNLSYSLNTIWNASFLIGLSMYSMWAYLGPSCISGVVVLCLTLPANSIITRKIKQHQQEAMKFKDQRIKVTFEVMDGIKVIKFNAWEQAFVNKINEIRGQELRHQRMVSYLTSIQSFFLQAAPVLSAMATFGTYVYLDPSNVLTAEKAFVSISYFNIIRHPMEWLPNFFNQITQAYVSIQRMNLFLGAKEVQDSDIGIPTDPGVAVEIIDGGFSWGDNSNTAINMDKLKVFKGELIGIVGRVGSGKSSLLSCFLNDMERQRGWIGVSGSKAYLPSQPFIRNATLRENILFGEVYNNQWYQRVLQACGLLPDVKLLVNGDSTEIGEKGVNLSGGQKQRVALARVIYSQKDIYLLDDPLSAVDVHVARHIFDHCFDPKKGLLGGKTVLFVTNSPTYLARMNRVIMLEKGSPRTVGNYELVKEHLSFLKHDSFANNLNRQDSTDAYQEHDKSKRNISEKAQEFHESSKLTSEEKIQTERVSKDVYLFYLKTIGLWFAMAAVLLHFISQSLLMGTNWWLVKWTAFEENISRSEGTLFYLFVYSLLGILSVFAVVGATVSVLAGGVSASTIIHHQVLESVLGTYIGFFESNPRGRIMNRFSTDLGWVDSELPSNYNMAIGAIFEFACIVVAICFVNVYFLITMIPVIIMTCFLQLFFVKTSRQVKRINSIKMSPVYSHLGETLSGLSTIRAFGASGKFMHEHENNVDIYCRCYLNNCYVNHWMRISMELVSSIIVLSAALFSVGGKEYITPGMVGLTISYAINLPVTLRTLFRSLAQIETRMVNVERLWEYTQLTKEDNEDSKLSYIKENWPERGKIEFRSFQARYRRNLDLALKDVTFHINSGENIGIVGRTGAGKSSITLALFRLMKETSGIIKIDGQDIENVPLCVLRSRLSIIPQEPFLFSGSIAFNVDPFGKHTSQKVNEALSKANLDKLANAQVSERGSNLSSGERQLMCLARALLRKSQVLILDEATAAVDPETDALVQETIRTEFGESTIITIAHRLDTVMNSDRIVVMEEGRIVEVDTPENLLANKNSKFSVMTRNSKAL